MDVRFRRCFGGGVGGSGMSWRCYCGIVEMHCVIFRWRSCIGGEELFATLCVRACVRWGVIQANAFTNTHVGGSDGGVLRASFAR
jgi:hypothetical protein